MLLNSDAGSLRGLSAALELLMLMMPMLFLSASTLHESRPSDAPDVKLLGINRNCS